MTYEVFNGARLPIKAWTRGVQVEEAAKQQLLNLAGMPFIHKHVAAMPDVHWGMGATVGSVIATKGAVIPAAVGVDIGCGMAAQRSACNVVLGLAATHPGRSAPHEAGAKGPGALKPSRAVGLAESNDERTTASAERSHETGRRPACRD